MAEPFLLIGGAALIFFLLLGDDKKTVTPKPQPPVVKPPPDVTDADKLAAHEAGVTDGYEAGLDDGSSGSPHAPSAPSKYADAGLQLVYAGAFGAGYSLGYDEGAAAKKDFTKKSESASEKGLYDGMAQGKIDAAEGSPFAPNPPYQYAWDSEMNATYQSYYMNGYNQGYTQVKNAGGGTAAGIHYASVEKKFHAGVRGLAAQNGGKFNGIVVMATVSGANGAKVEAAIVGEPRHVASLGREAMPAVVMSAGPYHGHKLVIVD